MMEWKFDIEKFKKDFTDGKIEVFEELKTLQFESFLDKNKINYFFDCDSHYRIYRGAVGHCPTFRMIALMISDLSEFYPLKPKSLFEQTLDLIGVKVEQEFYIKGLNDVYKIDKYGQVKHLNTQFNKWYGSTLTLTKILLMDVEISTEMSKPKSEAELVLDELKVVVDKANEILRKGGW